MQETARSREVSGVAGRDKQKLGNERKCGIYRDLV